MDLGTHALAGVAVGAAAARRAPLVAALATGVVASVLPDVLDVWLYPLDLELYRLWHRLFTHTLLAAPVIVAAAVAAGLAIGRTRRARAVTIGVAGPARAPWLIVAALIAVLLHLSLDLLCDWPLRLLYPFSTRDFALYLINYSHPAFTIGFVVLALGLLYPLSRPPQPTPHG